MNAAAMSGYRMLSDLGYVIGPIALGLATDLAGADVTLVVDRRAARRVAARVLALRAGEFPAERNLKSRPRVQFRRVRGKYAPQRARPAVRPVPCRNSRAV